MSLSRRQTVAALAAALPLGPAAAGTARAHGRGRPRPRTLHIAGDSTAAQKYADAAPEAGWGMALPYFLGGGLDVANHAVNGRSSKSFVDEGRLDDVLAVLRHGDILLIQFGHNDQKAADPSRYTEPWSTYQEHLLRFVRGARSRGAGAVLLTPVERRRFDAGGRAVTTHGEYPAAMRALAAREDVPLVDVQASSIKEWQALGPEPSKAYFNWLAPGESPNHPDGSQDNTHFRPRGAIEVARMVARGLRGRGVLPARDLRRIDEPVPAGWITWPPPPDAESTATATGPA
ncbi:rhamnogalacturonan acetylesterase [Streptomyces sp. SP18CS02]|uniref:rhamnogalacturonan acetylesterase n=1 Tax=Streptomyces sp. SP18CS02 TaxID=3002531 RepID=UPI002E7961F6|nr:rhamnogalacturonan acetylesterase [Streptomyces sp. SP18CS02]MEE1754863.1 rhamnogalacturonan acetylesterase [Streptomyces sp. SP18CS02]